MGGKKRLVFGVIVLILLAAANRLWFIFNLPLTSGETESLNLFIIPGVGNALTNYSSAHNHVLLSVLASLFSANGAIVRMLAMVASLASALVVFRLVLREQSARFAFFSAGVWMASLGGLVSGSFGRAHAFVAFFALTAYYAYIQLQNGDTGRVKWSAVFVLSSALGFWAVPTFVLPFLAIGLTSLIHYMLNRDHGLFVKNVTVLFLSILAGILLYLPILLNNPITALTDNWLIREHDLGNFTLSQVAAHARTVLANMDALIAALFIPFAFIAIWLQREWNGNFMSQAVIMVIVTLGYVGLAGKLPPADTLVFMVPFIIMAVSEGLHNGYHQVSQRFRKALMVLIALLPILVLINGNKGMYRHFNTGPVEVSIPATESSPNSEPAPLQ